MAAVTDQKTYRTSTGGGQLEIAGLKPQTRYEIERIANEIRIRPTNKIGVKVRANWNRYRVYTYMTELPVKVGDWVQLPDSGYGKWVGEVVEIGSEWTSATKSILGIVEPSALPFGTNRGGSVLPIDESPEGPY